MLNSTLLERTKTTVIVACIIIMTMLVVYTCNTRDKVIRDNTQENLEKIKYVDTTSFWRDKYNHEHAVREIAESNLRNVKVVYGEELKAKAAELNIKENKIKSIATIVLHRPINIDSLYKLYHTTDTLTRYRHVVYTDDNGLLTTDTAEEWYRVQPIYITLQDSLGITNYVKKRKLYIDVLNYQPDGSVIKSIDAFQVRSYEPAIRIRPIVGGIYTNEKRILFSTGIGLETKIFRLPIIFSIQKSF